MGIFSSFLWMLAGGSYMAASGAKNLIQSADHVPVQSNYSDRWYSENWHKIDHKRQRELGKMYMTKRDEFLVLANSVGRSCLTTGLYGWKYNVNIPGTQPENGEESFNKFLVDSLIGISHKEGWVADTSEYMLKHMKSKYNEPTVYELRYREKHEQYRVTHPIKCFTTNPDREAELWALIKVAKRGFREAAEKLLIYNNLLDGKFEIKEPFENGEEIVRVIMCHEGYASYTGTPLYRSTKGNTIYYDHGISLIQDKIDQKEVELLARYYNHDRQTELWRMLYYARKGNKAAKLDYYRLTDEGYEEIIEAFGEGDYLDDIELDETNFGKDGVAIYEFNRVAKNEGWLWDDSYPSAAKQKQLEQMFEREKSYADPTPLPWNHERQEDIYKARFCATELKDKAAQKSLLMFTGTRNSARLSEEKFFKLCSECAKEEGWAWDFDYLTPAKCREIVRKCAAEE